MPDHMTKAALGLALALATTLPAAAQDRRTVTEPRTPATCARLSAQLTQSGGAPSSETAFDTARVQAALTACPVGQAVDLTTAGPATAFLLQPIDVPSGVGLVVDAGVTVFASRNPADYQAPAGSGIDTCGTLGQSGNGCRALLRINGGAASSGSGLYGYGVIDGRGQAPLLVGGVPSSQSFWDLAAAASGSLKQNNPVLLDASKASAFTLYQLTLRSSPHFHVVWKGAGFTAWGVKIATPYTARNTDGIDPGGSDITITRCSISDGDDMVAVSASSASSYITVSNSHTYSGHGVSVGSYTQGGLTNLLVDHVNFAGTAGDGNANGLRLKSAQDRGGLVQNVTYQNLCLKDTKHLLLFDPFYATTTGTSVPQFSNIALRNVHFLTEGVVQLQGFDAAHATSVTFDNVVFDALAPADLSPAPQYTALSFGPGAVYPAFLQSLTGTGVTTSGSAPASTATAFDCTGAFPLLVGDLFLSTSSANNLGSLSLTTGQAFTLNAVVQPAMSQVSYGAWTGAAALTQAVQFLENGAVVGSGALSANGTLAQLTLPGAAAGAHTYTARYPGDTKYAPFDFGAATVTVTASTLSPSATQLVAPASVAFGAALTLSAQVTASGGTPTGTVSFHAGAALLGTAPLDANGTAALTLSSTSLAAGDYTLLASYSGDAQRASSDSPGAPFTVSAEPTTTALVLPQGPVPAGPQVTLEADVTSASGTPVGAVTFSLGGAAIDSAPLVSGKARLKVTPSITGTLSLGAAYAGGGNFAASTAPAATLQVVAPVALTPLPASLSLSAGRSAAVTLTLSTQAGFAGKADLSCSPSAAFVSCALTPSSVTLTGTAPAQVTVTIGVDSALAFAAPNPQRLEAALAPLFALLLWPRRRRRGRGAGLLLVLCCAAFALSACGGNTGLPASPQSVTITAATSGVNTSVTIPVAISN